MEDPVMSARKIIAKLKWDPIIHNTVVANRDLISGSMYFTLNLEIPQVTYFQF